MSVSRCACRRATGSATGRGRPGRRRRVVVFVVTEGHYRDKERDARNMSSIGDKELAAADRLNSSRHYGSERPSIRKRTPRKAPEGEFGSRQLTPINPHRRERLARHGQPAPRNIACNTLPCVFAPLGLPPHPDRRAATTTLSPSPIRRIARPTAAS
jgi:hypothetical protein